MRLHIISSVALLLAACTGASAEDAAWLEAAIAKAKPGAVIDVPTGDYDITDLKIRRDLTLRGPEGGGAVFFSAEVTEKGLFVPLAGVNFSVENLVFRDANSWDRNGAGIRHEGENLTVINCVFERNEDGILATGSETGDILIDRSRFIDSGFGDGMSHGIYVSSGATLTVRDSEFVGTRIGHHIKSLAGETTVSGTTLDDANGRTSYAIDASKGGKLTVTGNTITQSANSENWAIINYDLTRGGEAAPVVVRDNNVINHFKGGVFLRNATAVTPDLEGNDIADESGRLKLVGR